jgi:protein-tyrosine phosphatase
MQTIYWIGDEATPRLAIVARPRGGDWLADELGGLKRAGLDVLVSMLTPEENDELGLTLEQSIAERAGLDFRAYPIPDRTTPSEFLQFQRFISELSKLVALGRRVGVHCRGSIGRSTVVAAAILITLGWRSNEALRAIEKARGCRVPDTEEQRRWIEKFEPGKPFAPQ